MKPGLKRSLILGGSLTIAGPVLGVLCATLKMWHVFQTLGAADPGPVGAETLASHVGTATALSITGMAVGAVGLIIFLVALVRMLAGRSGRPVG
ncbi:MAG TPA: hypothetical protein VNQ90_08000 [Chthoniobacteraceae bacterium]|nr:hypothetical protein [Chthoniobacteraceae bacterium]